MPTLAGTDTAIKAATYLGRGRETEYRVKGSAGLVLAVTSPGRAGRSSKIWRAYYSRTRDGRQTIRKLKIGIYPAISLADARKRAAEVLAAVARGADPVEEGRAKAATEARASIKFNELVEGYLKDLGQAGVKTVDEVRRSLSKDALPALGLLRPADISEFDVEQVVDAVAARGSPAGARRLLTHLRGAFNWAIRSSPTVRAKFGLSVNPADPVGRGRRGRPGKYGPPGRRERWLTDAEIVELWRATENASPTVRDTLRLMLLLGQRRGEVCGARRTELSFGAAAVWELPGRRVKNGLDHVVPLSSLSASIFQAALARHDAPLVFPGDGADGATDPHSITTALHRLLHRSEIQLDPERGRFTPHDLRRTVESGLAKLRTPKEIRDRVLNHKDTSVGGQHYNRYDYLDEKREALALWERHVRNLLLRSGLIEGGS